MPRPIVDHVIAPLRCPSCELTTPSLCAACRDEIDLWRPSACLRCGAARVAECVCDELPSAVVDVASIWAFDGPVGDVIEAAKYAGQTWRLEVMKREVAGLLFGRVPLEGKRRVVPVPPAPRRFRRRGYDLAHMLARWVARAGRWRYQPRALRRGGGRPAQASLDREARFEAVRGAFVARRRLDGADVVLVDDVITTGATITHACKALAAAGAASIRVVSLARTRRRRVQRARLFGACLKTTISTAASRTATILDRREPGAQRLPDQ